MNTKIREHREKNNMTQEQLSSRLNIDRSSVAKWETGEAMPRSDKLPELARIFNCSIDDLFGSEQKNAADKSTA